MTRWTADRERRAIVQHVARCSFCAGLLFHGRHRQDRELLDAAERLAWEHATNDRERELFSRQARHTPGSVGDDENGLAHVLGARRRR